MFTARVIDTKDALAAFGLVRLCYPDIELSAWRAQFAAGKAGRGDAGCIAVADQRGTIHAACLYRLSLDPRFGRRLEISYLSRAELPASTASDVLFDFVDSFAREKACAQIVVEDSDSRIAKARLASWTEVGKELMEHHFRPGSVGFVKAVAA